MKRQYSQSLEALFQSFETALKQEPELFVILSAVGSPKCFSDCGFRIEDLTEGACVETLRCAVNTTCPDCGGIVFPEALFILPEARRASPKR